MYVIQFVSREKTEERAADVAAAWKAQEGIVGVRRLAKRDGEYGVAAYFADRPGPLCDGERRVIMTDGLAREFV